MIAFTRADWIEGTEALPNGGSLYREVCKGDVEALHDVCVGRIV